MSSNYIVGSIRELPFYDSGNLDLPKDLLGELILGYLGLSGTAARVNSRLEQLLVCMWYPIIIIKKIYIYDHDIRHTCKGLYTLVQN